MLSQGKNLNIRYVSAQLVKFKANLQTKIECIEGGATFYF